MPSLKDLVNNNCSGNLTECCFNITFEEDNFSPEFDSSHQSFKADFGEMSSQGTGGTGKVQDVKCRLYSHEEYISILNEEDNTAYIDLSRNSLLFAELPSMLRRVSNYRPQLNEDTGEYEATPNLYELSYDYIDYNYSLSLFEKMFKTHEINEDVPNLGGCSATFVDGELPTYDEDYNPNWPDEYNNPNWRSIVLRNYDYTYDFKPTFIVHTPRILSRYSTVGTCSTLSTLEENDINQIIEESSNKSKLQLSDKVLTAFRTIPFMLLDGMNEKGLYCNINLSPTDSIRTTGTTPLIEKRYSICQMMLPRFILDNFKTAQEAYEYIRDYVEVYAPINEEAGVDLECHFYLIDPIAYDEDMGYNHSKQYVLEFVDNEPVLRELIAYEDISGITNYRVTDTYDIYAYNYPAITINTEGDGLDIDNIHNISKYGQGLERANIIAYYRDTEWMNQFYIHDTFKEVLDALHSDFRDKLRYSRTYTNDFDNADYFFLEDSSWDTEFVGLHPHFGDLRITTEHEYFRPIREYAETLYANRSRNKDSEYFGSWLTCHSVTYDLYNKKMIISIQEKPDNFTFTLDEDKSTIDRVKQIIFNDSKIDGKPSKNYMNAIFTSIEGDSMMNKGLFIMGNTTNGLHLCTNFYDEEMYGFVLHSIINIDFNPIQRELRLSNSYYDADIDTYVYESLILGENGIILDSDRNISLSTDTGNKITLGGTDRYTYEENREIVLENITDGYKYAIKLCENASENDFDVMNIYSELFGDSPILSIHNDGSVLFNSTVDFNTSINFNSGTITVSSDCDLLDIYATMNADYATFWGEVTFMMNAYFSDGITVIGNATIDSVIAGALSLDGSSVTWDNLVTQQEKNDWNSKQTYISDLDTIRTNASAGYSASQRIPATAPTSNGVYGIKKTGSTLTYELLENLNEEVF